MNFPHMNSTVNPGDGQLQLISAIVMTIMQVLNFLIGIPLNIYVLVLLTRAGGLEESVFFAISQCISEILYAISAPLYILYILSIFFYINVKFFSGLGMMARLVFQCLVCVERYLAVVHPVTFLKFKPLKYRLICLNLAWTSVLTCSIILIFASDVVFLDFFGSLFVFVVIMELFCFVSILKVLKRPAPGKREDSGMNNTKKKAFRIVLVNLLTHLIQMVPNGILFSLQSTMSFAVMLGIISITMSVNIAGGFMSPLFYLHRAGKLTVTCKNSK